MRRQTISGEAFAGASSNLRLDPFELPVRFAVPMQGRAPGAAVLTAEITPDMVVIERSAPGGNVRQVIALVEYRGVAVRMAKGATEGDLKVVVELMHANPALSLPLIVADDPAEVAADWQAWAWRLGLPLLLVEADGKVVEPVQRAESMKAGRPAPRRRHSYFAARRPRFLVRRKVGLWRSPEFIEAVEMIPRD